MPRRRPHTRTKNGKLQLFVRVHHGPGGLRTTTREKTVTPAEIEAWVTEQRLKYGPASDVAGGLRATVATYLETRTAMPTLAQHTAHLELWVQALGADRPPMSVTTDEITRVIDGWMKAGLANDTIRKRRSALRTFYARMYPKALSPVKGSPNPKAPKPEAREIAQLNIDAAIQAMPTYRSTKPGAPRRLSLSKLRLRLMADTGFPPGIVAQLTPFAFNPRTGQVRVSSREKGEGVEPRTITLVDDALVSMKAFHAANAYGRFALSSCNRSFKRGCKAIGLEPRNVTQYDLRHSYLTQYYRVTKDEATVQRVGLHAPGSRCTHRYTIAAHAEIDAASAKAFSRARVQLRRATFRSQRLPKKVAQNR